MMARRRIAIPAGPSTSSPSLSGPRWRSVAFIARSTLGSTAPARSGTATPQMPHTLAVLAVHGHGSMRDPPHGGEHDAQVQAHRAVGDVLEVVGELLAPRHPAGDAELG